MNGQKVDRVKFAWRKGSDTVSNLVGGFVEFGFGARVWGAPPKVSMFITTRSPSEQNDSGRNSV
jgi:hypothetical protein